MSARDSKIFQHYAPGSELIDGSLILNIDSIPLSCRDSSDVVMIGIKKRNKWIIEKKIPEEHRIQHSVENTKFFIGNLSRFVKEGDITKGRRVICPENPVDTSVTNVSGKLDSILHLINHPRYLIDGSPISLGNAIIKYKKNEITKSELEELFKIIIDRDFNQNENSKLINESKIPDQCFHDVLPIMNYKYKDDLNECESKDCTSILIQYSRNIKLILIMFNKYRIESLRIRSIISGMSTEDCHVPTLNGTSCMSIEFKDLHMKGTK